MKSVRITLAHARQAWRVLGDARDLRNDRPAQGRAVVDGLCRLFGADNGFHIQIDDYCPGGRSTVRRLDYGTSVDPLLVDWFEGDLARSRQPSDDLMVVHTIARPARAIVVTQREFIPHVTPADHPVYFDVIRRYRLQDNLALMFRPGTSNDAWGYALHRRDVSLAFSVPQRRLALAMMIEMRHLHHAGHISPPAPIDLPRRQGQVLDALLRGQSPKTIAADLNLSVHTVRDHIKALLPRFGVNGVSELIAQFVNKP